MALDRIDTWRVAASRAGMGSSNYMLRSNPRISPPKIDATDRRLIDALNENKSHTTKEAMDDIKHVHQKEKKKKEMRIVERYNTRISSQSTVR